MSAIPSGGVSIPFVPDTSQVDAWIANLRAHPPTVGVTFAPGQPSSPGQPATFGNPGGVPFSSVTNNVSNSSSFNSNTLNQAVSNVSNTLNQLSSTVNNVSASLTQAVHNIDNSVSNIDNSIDNSVTNIFNQGGGGGGRGGNRGLANFSRLRRLFTGGAAVYTAVRAGDAVLDYFEAERSTERRAGGGFSQAAFHIQSDPLSVLENQIKFSHELASSVPLLGHAVEAGTQGIIHSIGGKTLEDQAEDIRERRRIDEGRLSNFDFALRRDAANRATNERAAILGITPNSLARFQAGQAASLRDLQRQNDIAETNQLEVANQTFSRGDAVGFQNEIEKLRLLRQVNAGSVSAHIATQEGQLAEFYRESIAKHSDRDLSIIGTGAELRHDVLGARISANDAARIRARKEDPDHADQIDVEYADKEAVIFKNDREEHAQSDAQRQFRIQSTEHLINYRPFSATLTDIEAARSQAHFDAEQRGGAGKTEAERSLDLKRRQRDIDNEFDRRVVLSSQQQNDQIQFSISQRSLSTGATQALIAHNPLGAELIQNEKARQAAVDAATKGERNQEIPGINAAFSASEALIRQRSAESIQTQLFSIQNNTGRLNILNDLSKSPGQRTDDAALFDIRAKYNADARDAILTGRGTDVLQALTVNARAQLTNLSVRKLDSLSAEEVDPLRTQLSGPNSEDFSKALQDIEDMKNSLKDIPTTFAQLLEFIRQLVQGQ